MTIQQFIADAIKGGFHLHGTPYISEHHTFHSAEMLENEDTMIVTYEYTNKGEVVYPKTTLMNTYNIFMNEIVLDPKAWEAVGKVKGWGETVGESQGTPPPVLIMGRYDRPSAGGFIWDFPQYLMHRMIDALYEGRTIEEYIATL